MTTNIQLARQVARFVQLRSITLKSAHVESFFDPAKVPPTVRISQQHRCNFSEASENEQRAINVVAEFQFEASNDGDEAQKEVAKLTATFLLVYSLPTEASFEERCLKYFAELNGPYNAWPYWRELVQTATGRIGLSGIMVPLYRPVGVEVPEPANVPEEQNVLASAN